MNYHLAVTAVVAVVLCLRALFRRYLSPRWIHVLWLAVLLRLLLPLSFPVELKVLPPAEVPPQASVEKLPSQKPAGSPVLSRPAANLPVESRPAASLPAVSFPAELPTAGELSAALSEGQRTLTWEDVKGLGTALLALWFGISGIGFWRSLHVSRRPDGKIGALSVYRTPKVDSPCLAGPIPAVYLPMGDLPVQERELILRHEYCHFRRLDPLWNLVRVAVLCLFWYNPALWIAAHYSKLDGELACDEAVCSQFSTEKRLFYANTLVNAVQTNKRFALPWGGSPMKERIRMLTEKRKRFLIPAILVILLSLCTVGCSLLEVKTVPKENEKETVEKTKEEPSEGSTNEETIPASSTKREEPAASVTPSSMAGAYDPEPSVPPMTPPAVPTVAPLPPPSTQAVPRYVREAGRNGEDSIRYYNGLTLSLRIPEDWLWDEDTGTYSGSGDAKWGQFARLGVRWDATMQQDIVSEYERAQNLMLWDNPKMGTNQHGHRYLVVRSVKRSFCGDGMEGYQYDIYFPDAPIPLNLSMISPIVDPEDYIDTVVLPLVKTVNIAPTPVPEVTHVSGKDGVDVISYPNGRTLSFQVPEGWFWEQSSKMYYTLADNIWGMSKRMQIRWGASMEEDRASEIENGDEITMLWDEPVLSGTNAHGLRYVTLQTKMIAFGGSGAPGRVYHTYFPDAPTSLDLHVQYYSLEDPADYFDTVVKPLIDSVNIT